MKQYYVQDARQIVGNCMVWYRKGGHGYCCDLDDAEVFDGDSDEFLALIRHNGPASLDPKYIPWPKGYIDASAVRHVNRQHVSGEQADAHDP